MSGPQPAPQNEQEEAAFTLPIQRFIEVVLRRPWAIGFGIIVAVGLGTLYFFQATPIYESTAQVMVVKKSADKISVEGQMGPYDDYLPTHIVLLQSPLLVGNAITKGDLRKLPSLRGEEFPIETITDELTLSRESMSARGTTGNTNVINLNLRLPVAEDCPVILNALIQQYDEFLKTTYQDVSDETLKFISAAKDELSAELVGKEQEYIKLVREAPGLIRVAPDGTPVALDQGTAELEVVHATILKAKADLTAKIQALETAIADNSMLKARLMLASWTSDRNATTQRETHVMPLIIEEQTLLRSHGPQHPKVQAVRERITYLNQFLLQPVTAWDQFVVNAGAVERVDTNTEVTAYLEGLKEQLSLIKSEEKEFDVVLDERENELRQSADYELKLLTVKEEIRRISTLYDAVTQRLRDVDLATDSGGYVTRLITMPEVGEQVEPDLLIVAALSLVLGTLFGTSLAFILDFADASFRSPEEIRARLGLAIMGTIPSINDKHLADVIPGSQMEPSLRAFHRPKSRLAEAYRSVRTQLYFSLHGKGHQIIQVTSAEPGDGKSTLSANLAITIAQSSKKTLIIDADFRRPRVHKIFGVGADVGMSNVIANEVELMDAVQPTEVDNLFVMPCGPKPSNPSELLSSTRFGELLDALKDKFDFVIVDTPPMLIVTDPSVVAARVDGVLLTVRLRKNARPTAIRAAEALDTIGAKVLGVVVNAVDPKSGYGYGYGYGGKYGGYGYGYGYNESYDDDNGGYYDSDDEEEAGQNGNGKGKSKRKPATSRYPSKN